MSSHLDFATVPAGVEGVNPNHPCAEHARIIDADKGLVERKRDKLAICGYATSTRDLAPWGDPEYSIIGLNALYRMIPRADFWADLHMNWAEHNPDGVDHEGWIRDCGIPVLMTERHDNLPTSVRFPIEAILEDIGVDYFTSTVSLLIGWAVWMKFSEISLFGIDLVVGTEYMHQKSSAEFLLGVAHGRGITVRIPPGCALLKATHRYGYELEPESKLLKLSDVETRKAQLTAQREALLTKMRAFDGAIHEVGKLREELSGPQPTEADAMCAKLGERHKWLTDTRFETMMELSTIDGALQEAAFTFELMTLRSRGADIRMG